MTDAFGNIWLHWTSRSLAILLGMQESLVHSGGGGLIEWRLERLQTRTRDTDQTHLYQLPLVQEILFRAQDPHITH